MNTNFTSSCFRRRTAIVQQGKVPEPQTPPRFIPTRPSTPLGCNSTPSRFRFRIALANEDERDGLIGLENEFAVGTDGWVRIAPYGESIKERMFRHKDGREEQQTFVQQLDRAAAEEMVRKFNSPWGKLKRFVRGLPIYKRHPDLQEHAPGTISHALANDKTACGMFAELEAREDGFYGKPVVSESGQTAIENEGLKWLSPFWWAKPAGKTRNGTPIMRPTELISAGLTDRPNIQGGEALANQREREHMNKQKLLAALGKLGIALANEATDEQIETAIAGLVPKTNVTALENEKQTLTNANKTAEQLLASEKTLRVNAEGTVTQLTTALENERVAKVKAVLDTAILQGRITAAERDAWQGKLKESFDLNVTALANEKQKVKTTATTENAGTRKPEAATASEASEQFLALANELAVKEKIDFQIAWKRTKKANPALYEAMSAKAA